MPFPTRGHGWDRLLAHSKHALTTAPLHSQIGYLLTAVRSRAVEAAQHDAQGAEDAAFSASGSSASARNGASGSSEGPRGLVQDDARAVAAAALEAAISMRAHAEGLERCAEHLFLPPAQAAGIRQRLLPRARDSATALERLAIEAALVELAIECGYGVEEWTALLGEAEGEVGGEDAPDQGAPKAKFAFDAEQLAWGRKEAKARLSPEEFKAWRKAAKAA